MLNIQDLPDDHKDRFTEPPAPQEPPPEYGYDSEPEKGPGADSDSLEARSLPEYGQGSEAPPATADGSEPDAWPVAWLVDLKRLATLAPADTVAKQRRRFHSYANTLLLIPEIYRSGPNEITGDLGCFKAELVFARRHITPDVDAGDMAGILESYNLTRDHLAACPGYAGGIEGWKKDRDEGRPTVQGPCHWSVETVCDTWGIDWPTAERLRLRYLIPIPDPRKRQSFRGKLARLLSRQVVLDAIEHMLSENLKWRDIEDNLSHIRKRTANAWRVFYQSHKGSLRKFYLSHQTAIT